MPYSLVEVKTLIILSRQLLVIIIIISISIAIVVLGIRGWCGGPMSPCP
jgi:hypothetical protein